MDFTTDPEMTQEGNNSILVVGYSFSKMAHSIPCKKAIDVIETTTLVIKHVVHLHGVPRSIVSGRDVKFTSHY